MAAKNTNIDDVSSSLTYIGEAAVGALDSEPKWRISRITVSGTETKIRYAGGETTWNSVWNDRASLAYI